MSLAVAVGSFALVAAALTVTPGLDTALVLRAGLLGPRRQAMATGAGIVAGLFLWATAAAAGVSALLAASTLAYDVLRYAGAAFLVVVGGRLLLRAVRTRSTDGLVATPSTGSAWRAARLGLVTNLLNPKVGVFYLALLPQFLPAGADPVLVGLLLAAVHGALSLAWFGLLALLAARFARWLSRPGARRGIDGTTGAILVGFGVRLALPSG